MDTQHATSGGFDRAGDSVWGAHLACWRHRVGSVGVRGGFVGRRRVGLVVVRGRFVRSHRVGSVGVRGKFVGRHR